MAAYFLDSESTLPSQRITARRDSNGIIIIPASSLDSDSVKDGVLMVEPCSSTCACYDGGNSRKNSELLLRSRGNSVVTNNGNESISSIDLLSVKTVNLSMPQPQPQPPRGKTTHSFKTLLKLFHPTHIESLIQNTSIYIQIHADLTTTSSVTNDNHQAKDIKIETSNFDVIKPIVSASPSPLIMSESSLSGSAKSAALLLKMKETNTNNVTRNKRENNRRSTDHSRSLHSSPTATYRVQQQQQQQPPQQQQRQSCSAGGQRVESSSASSSSSANSLVDYFIGHTAK